MSRQFSRSGTILLGQIINGLISFTGLAIWARIATPSDISKVLITGSFCLVCSDFLDFGGNSWISREVSHRNLTFQYFWNFAFCKFRLIVSLSIIVSAILFLLGNEISYCFYVMIAPSYLLLSAYFQGMIYINSNNLRGFIAQFIERIFWFTPLIMVKVGISTVSAIFWALVFGQILSLVFISTQVMQVLKNDSRELNVKYSLRETYNLSSRVGISSVVSDLYSLDTFLVSRFASLSAAGNFALIHKNRNVAVLGFSLISSRIRLLIFQNKRQVYDRLVTEKLVIILNTCGILFVFLFAPNLINIIFGSEYMYLSSALRVSAVSFLFLGIISVMQGILSSFRDDVFLSYFTLAMVFNSLLFLAIGSAAYDFFGACIGLGLSYLAQTFILNARINSLLRLRQNQIGIL